MVQRALKPQKDPDRKTDPIAATYKKIWITQIMDTKIQ